MPFRSLKQKGWMFLHKPEIAKKWTRKYGSKIEPGKNKIGEAHVKARYKK